MATIRSEHENQNRIIQGQKSALDGIISELGSIRFMGKDKDLASGVPSRRSTPAPEGEGMEAAEEVAEAVLTVEMPLSEEKEEGEEDKQLSESPPATATEEMAEDDIEMGEVEENPKNGKLKKKLRVEELEEGEASDTSSALSDPPDD